jgi:prepilin-type N-terminal cleavage/methylation domain-containing protein
MVLKIRNKSEAGFTLIELLTVVAVIGLLAAIAIPQFTSYKSRGFNARVLSDVKNAITAEEALFVDTEQYIECSNDECSNVLPNFRLGEGTQIAIGISGDGLTFDVTANHPQGSMTVEYDSSAGNFETTID